MNTHDSIRSRIAADDFDAEVERHLRECAACRQWQSLLDQVVAAAPTLFDTGDDSALSTERTIAAVRRSRRQRWSRPAIGVAAAAVIALGVAGFVVSQTGSDHGRLHDVADSYVAAGEIRFVFEGDADVPVAVPHGTGDTLEPLTLMALPTCETDDSAGDNGDRAVSDRIDLRAVVDSLIDPDPCAALAAISVDVGGAAQDHADDLVAVRASWQRAESGLVGEPTSASQLSQATIEQLAQDAQAALTQVDRALTELTRAHQTTAASMTPVAAEPGEASNAVRRTAQSELQALVDIIDDNTDIPTPPEQIRWEILATGTWSPSAPAISGSVSTPAATTALTQFEIPGDDPLGLATIMFADPDTFLELLRSAPTSGELTVTWIVPAGVLEHPDIDTWTARADLLDDTALDRLVITGNSSQSPVTITLTIIPAR